MKDTVVGGSSRTELELAAAFDPRSIAVMDDPYPYYRAIARADVPVYCPDADTFAVGSHRLCTRVLADAQTFSVARGVQYYDEAEVPSGIPLLILTDPPEHTRLRRFMGHAFKEDSIPGFATDFRSNFESVLDRLPGRPCDLMADLIMPWAIENSLSLLEIPEPDRPQWRGWMSTYFYRERGNLGFTAAGDTDIEHAMIYLVGVHLPALRGGGDSFLGRILQTRIDGETMTDGEALGLLMTMAVVGAEDTARTLANLLRQCALDSSVAAADAYGLIDETIRHSPSTHYVRRTTTSDIDIDDVLIPAGSKVLVLFAAANRDARIFDDPDRFDPERSNAHRAMGFSRGAHSCLGIHVARLQLHEGLSEFRRRVSWSADFDTASFVHSMNISGFQHIPADVEIVV